MSKLNPNANLRPLWLLAFMASSRLNALLHRKASSDPGCAAAESSADGPGLVLAAGDGARLCVAAIVVVLHDFATWLVSVLSWFAPIYDRPVARPIAAQNQTGKREVKK
jgi:hypothetical protein